MSVLLLYSSFPSSNFSTFYISINTAASIQIGMLGFIMLLDNKWYRPSPPCPCSQTLPWSCWHLPHAASSHHPHGTNQILHYHPGHNSFIHPTIPLHIHTWREQTCRSSLSKTVIVIAPALAPHINSSFDFKSATVIDLSILFSLVNEVMLEVMNTVTTSPVTTLKVSLPRA